MAGTLPNTALLLTRNGRIIAHCKNWQEVADALGVTITQGGYVVAGGVRRNPCYVLKAHSDWNGFEPDAARVDWVRYHSSGYFAGNNIRVYRFLT